MAVAVVTAVLLGGCSRDARLYPANVQAGPTMLQAKFVDSGMGRGPIELTLPDGEVLTGEFSTSDTSSYGFGTGVAYSAYQRPVVATGSTTATPGSMPGVASLVGPKGTTAQCEYTVNTWTSSGSGVCRISNGAVYNLHF